MSEPSTQPAARFEEARALASRGEFLGARRLCREVLAQLPDHPGSAVLLFNIACQMGAPDEGLDAMAPILDRFAENPDVCSAVANAANAAWKPSPERVFDLHAAYGRALAKARPSAALEPRDPAPERTLRIGIVTYDFKSRSSVSFFLAPALRHIPPGFEVTAYHVGPEDDAGTARFRGMVHRFRLAAGMSHDQLAAQVRADGIDVALELIGHTGVRGLPAFQPRCAPVQVSYLGYSNTTGVPSMDWRIVDSTTDPAGTERLSVERLCRLDPCFVCFDPDLETPRAAAAPSVYKDHVTFGCFSELFKLNAWTMRRWARVLEATPGSRLLIKNRAPARRDELAFLHEQLATAGIDPRRVEIRRMTRTYPEHLAMYGDVDIALDTWPYNGTTTVCDALVMGVPIVGVAPGAAHDRHAARVTLSLLSGAGLQELIVRDEDALVAKCADLASDPDRLNAMRTSIRERFLASPVCDSAAFAQRFWGALRGMWRDRVGVPVSETALVRG